MRTYIMIAGMLLNQELWANPSDWNGNGMADSWEMLYPGVAASAPTADSDGDGRTNADESKAFTNPFDPAERLELSDMRWTGDRWRLQWKTEAGLNYQVLWSSDLQSWNTVGLPRPGTGGVVIAEIAPAALPVGADSPYWKVAVRLPDTDADGLGDAEEKLIGSDPLSSSSMRAASQGGDGAYWRDVMLGANPLGGAAGTASSGVPSELNASRFLAQASMGPIPEEIAAVRNLGYAGWLNAQFNQPVELLLPYIRFLEGRRASDVPNASQLPYLHGADYVFADNCTTPWMRNALWSPGQLRQRLTWALGQIFVVSTQDGNLFYRGEAVADFYDTLSRGAFGNFKDLLNSVTKHPAMGVYLSSIFNRKPNPEINQYPDENYAREIMQLFSIGLRKLNPDGSPVLDANGEEIPTYTHADIKEMARVFTGFRIQGQPWGILPVTGSGLSSPMASDETQHDTNPKRLPDGTILPAGQGVSKDVDDAVTWLFNHPNTAPFISERLIRFLVTSNPSRAYVKRVSDVFANNGQGIRGDMKAIVSAILLDPEARGLDYITNPNFGRMKEPVIRMTTVARMLKAGKTQSSSTDLSGFQFWWTAYLAGSSNPLHRDMEQHPLASPTVFNFFNARYQLPGEVASAGLYSPEMQMLNPVTATASINRWFSFLPAGYHSNPSQAGQPPRNDWAEMIAMSRAGNDEEFLDRINLLLGNTRVGPSTRNQMKSAIQWASAGSFDQHRAMNGIMIALAAPECVIQK